MASFHTKTFTKHDDYYTPAYAWENIKKYIPHDKVIWEAFYGNGNSGNVLKKMGFNVINEDIDFFENNKGDIVVSNPPFTKKKEILTRLVELDKPFILIMPASTITCQYVNKLFIDKKNRLKIIIPRKRIQFEKLVNDKLIETKKCNFDCFYYCWKIDTVKKEINWLK